MKCFVLVALLTLIWGIYGIELQNHEPLQIMPDYLQRQLLSDDPNVLRVRFHAFGKDFSLLVFEDDFVSPFFNSHLDTVAAANYQFYRGIDENSPDSVVVGMYLEDTFIGSIHVPEENEIYHLELAATFYGDPQLRGAVIYRHSESIPFEIPCTATHHPRHAPSAADTLANPIGNTSLFTNENAHFNTNITHVVCLVADQRFQQIYGARTSALMTTLLHQIAHYYRVQLGVDLRLGNIKLLGEGDLPQTTDSEKLLESFSAWVAKDEQLMSSCDIVHLFTGQDLDNGIAGKGFIGTACQRDGTQVSISRHLDPPYTNDHRKQLLAHEIGHNHGAEHDAEPGSTCEHEQCGYFMSWSGACRDVPRNNRFSPCSLRCMLSSVGRCSSS